jgi:hypothetical protein
MEKNRLISNAKKGQDGIYGRAGMMLYKNHSAV